MPSLRLKWHHLTDQRPYGHCPECYRLLVVDSGWPSVRFCLDCGGPLPASDVFWCSLCPQRVQR